MEIKYLGFIIVGIIALFAGCNTLDGELVSDDFVLMEAAERVGIVEMFTANWLGERGSGGFYRPMVLASWKLDHCFYDRDPRGYHFTNLMLHLAVTLMMYLLVWRFHKSIWIALPAAGLFAVHPIHVEAVAWISGRTDTVAAAFYLLSVLCFLTASRQESPRGTVAGVVALVSGICAMLSKEIAYTLPLTLFALNRLLPPENGSRNLRRTTIPYFFSLGTILVVRYLTLGSVLGGYGAGKHLRFDGVIFNYLIFYLQWFMKPFSLPGSTSDPVWMILLWGCFVLSLMALLSPVYRPGIIWFWITMLPVLNICRAQYVYIPSIGLFWLLAAVVFGNKYMEDRNTGDIIRTVTWVCLLLVFLLNTWEKNRQWSTTGWVGKGVEKVMRSLMPVMPSGSRVVVINPPVNSTLNIGVFQNGIREAVRLWYDDSSLDAVRVAQPEQYSAMKTDWDAVWEFREGLIYHIPSKSPAPVMDEFPWPDFDSPLILPDHPTTDLATVDQELSGIIITSQLANAASLPDGTPVAEVRVDFDDGRQELLALRAGEHTSEWAFDRPDVRERVRHRRAPVAYSYIAGAYPEYPTPGHIYKGTLMFDIPGIPTRIIIHSLIEPLSSDEAHAGDPMGIKLEIRSVSGLI